MKAIAIITARGGSKRIPKKNIKDFLGKPIIAYSIKAALDSKMFDEVMVSTDSKEIAEIAIQYGACVPFYRSKETSNDFATTADVIEEVIANYKRMGKEFDTFMCIYPTAPFLSPDIIIQAYSLFNGSCVLPVVKYSFPPQRAFVIHKGYVKYKYPEFCKFRSQDLEPIYHDCGQFYLCSIPLFLEKHTVVLPNAVPLIMDDKYVQDIDTFEDWEIAENKYKLLRG